MLFLVIYFVIAKSSLVLWVPVDHAKAAIDESLVVEVNKHFDYAFRAFFVHSEGSAIPVARCAELFELLEDDATVSVSPIPSVLEKLFASEVGLLDAFSSKLVDDLCFGSDRSVVSARNPKCILALHASTADKDVLDRVVEHVSHVEHTCHVRWWDYDSIWFSIVRLRVKQTMFHPVLIPFAFHFGRVVFCC